MVVREVIISKINELKFTPVMVTEQMNLYTDLGFDSLNFISLIMEIEEACSIVIEIVEMESCLQVEYLIDLVEKKIKESAAYD